MASTLVQVRIDDELKNQTTAVYDALGIDLPTAVRMYEEILLYERKQG